MKKYTSLWNRLLVKLSSRKCWGCKDPSPHSHHLTWIGKLRYL